MGSLVRSADNRGPDDRAIHQRAGTSTQFAVCSAAGLLRSRNSSHTFDRRYTSTTARTYRVHGSGAAHTSCARKFKKVSAHTFLPCFPRLADPCARARPPWRPPRACSRLVNGHPESPWPPRPPIIITWTNSIGEHQLQFAVCRRTK